MVTMESEKRQAARLDQARAAIDKKNLSIFLIAG